MPDQIKYIVYSLLITGCLASNASADTYRTMPVYYTIPSAEQINQAVFQTHINRILLQSIKRQRALSKVKLGMVFTVEDLNIATSYVPQQQFTTDDTDRIFGFYVKSRF